MCNPMILLAAGTTMAVSGQLAQGKAAQRAANEDAALREYEGLVEQDNALYQAGQIRRAGQRQRGATLAGIAASGVKVGDGSALDIERQVMEDSEVDARLAILSGDRRARGLRTQAELTRRAGRDARRAANMQAVNTLISAGAKGFGSAGVGSGWDAGGYSGTNDRSLLSTGNNMDWFLRNGSSGD